MAGNGRDLGAASGWLLSGRKTKETPPTRSNRHLGIVFVLVSYSLFMYAEGPRLTVHLYDWLISATGRLVLFRLWITQEDRGTERTERTGTDPNPLLLCCWSARCFVPTLRDGDGEEEEEE